MGLLDLLNNDDSRFALSLLAAAGPSRDPMSFGQRALGAVQQFDQFRGQRDEAEARKKEREDAARERMLREQMAKMQMDQMLAAAEQAQAARAREAQFRGAISPQPITPLEAASGGPTVANAARIGQTPAVDWQTLARQFPDRIEDIKKLSEAQNFGRQEVARTVEGMSADGVPVTYQLDKYGGRVGEAVPKWMKDDLVDLGGAIFARNPASGKMVPVGTKTVTPEALLSAETTRRGQNMTDARAAQRLALEVGQFTADAGGPGQIDLVRRFGKPPANHRWRPDGSVEPIPGGPADIKAGEVGAKKEQQRQSVIVGANNVLDIVNDARNAVGPTTAGFGSWMAAVPASEARNLQAKLETIKANLGFDRLQQMRNESPTGGALGQVAVQELAALQASVASLDQAQSPTQLRAALNRIENHYERWLETVGAPRKRPKLIDAASVQEEADRIIRGR